MIKVLLVEDEATLAMIIQDTLNAENFDVTLARNGKEGLELLNALNPDIVVTDIMMPQMDGFEMVRRLRQEDKQTPILFLTARSGVNDVVDGFNLGGDDYLRKPFSMLELMVRIKALVARSAKQRSAAYASVVEPVVIPIGRYTLCTSTQILSMGDDYEEELSHRESEVLHMLAQHVNEVVSSQDILLSLWGDDSPYNARSLHVFITKIRHKLAGDPTLKILNVRGIGYKLAQQES